jgi:hypothetical protein
MRSLIIIAGALALAACGNNDQSDNTANVDENLTAQNIVSNDVTAIDAVTGDAANMAAESDINDLGNISNASNALGNSNAFPRPRPQTVTPKGSSAPATPAPSPVSNTASNAVTNGE